MEVDVFVVAWLDVFASSEVLFSVASDYVGTVTFASDDVGRLPDTFNRVKHVNRFAGLKWAEVFRRFAVVLRGLGLLPLDIGILMIFSVWVLGGQCSIGGR